MALMGTFVTMAPGAPVIAAGALAGNTILSFLKGYTTTAAIGGADMREFKHLSSHVCAFCWLVETSADDYWVTQPL